MDLQKDEQGKIVALTAMAQNFEKTIPPELMGLWLDLLKGYSAKQVGLAVSQVIMTYQFKTLPPFAVFKEQLDKVCGMGKAAIESKAYDEWDHVLAEVRRCGTYRVPKLNQQTADAVRQLGGFDEICRTPEKDLKWKQKNFIELWVQQGEKSEHKALSGGNLAIGEESNGRI